jgi:hypothetical protein
MQLKYGIVLDGEVLDSCTYLYTLLSLLPSASLVYTIYLEILDVFPCPTVHTTEKT